ncbi:hypothetical protein [Sphaerotilus mobilis]|uniref:Uncharacterized protein n=1 Tax=Sphaerotilus mobilis TaxID=47994 RepID=A0A4Q7LQZ5_9BURK|nr:hypothetical protein [Sphaerotilus mobilis]RZS56811.1 hypothetical protein EV685_1366 [Sphaerotilus mobilis]
MTNANTAAATATTSTETPATFSREQGCSEAEWQGWLPGAVGPHPWRSLGPGRAEVQLDASQPGARLLLDWETLPPRQIALLRMPRLAVRFTFEACNAQDRARFMDYFDLYTRRGGG